MDKNFDKKIVFEDGMVKDYSCDNLPSEKENKLFIKENLLQNRETLPIGEFAIGTNTTAYAMARKYNILYKLPILIVEKMGPHFAIGDTCYSYEEDVMTYNPDGKAIIARENELSALRDVEPEKAGAFDRAGKFAGPGKFGHDSQNGRRSGSNRRDHVGGYGRYL